MEKLFQFNGGPFDLYTIGWVGLEIIERLESLHKYNIVHNNIKPANLCWGKFLRSSIINKNTIYFIDLRLANNIKEWQLKYNPENNYESLEFIHYEQKENKSHPGTPIYMSVNINKGLRISWQTDMESMIIH